MTPMVLNLGGGDFLALALLAAVLFGPEKVPELAKKLGRIVQFLRGIANNATDQIKAELGPEFADLKPSDLKPANLINMVIPAETQSELQSMRAELESMRTSLAQLQKDTAGDVRLLADQVTETVSPPAVKSANIASDAAADASSSKSTAKPFWMTT